MSAADFILLGKFFESFSFYGIKTILFLFLFSKMNYTKDQSTYLFHIFLMLVGTLPLFGIYITKASSEKLTKIVVLSFFYTIGCILLVLGLAKIMHTEENSRIAIFIGLVLIAICSGGIKIYSFAAGIAKFKLPEEASTFKLFLLVISCFVFVGSALSTAIAPVLREYFHCFGEYGCFLMAFAPLVATVILATIIFLAGAIVSVAGSNYTAGSQQTFKTNIFFTILLLYLPLSFFWALFEQQGSRWTQQATRMASEVLGYNIKPDQMQLSYYLLILILSPIFKYVIYPILYLIGFRTPLKKIFLGGLLAAAAFYLAACLEVTLERLDPVLPNSTTAQIRIFNGMHCDCILLQNDSTETAKIEPLGYYETKIFHEDYIWFHVNESIDDNNNEFSCIEADTKIKLELGKTTSYFIREIIFQPLEISLDKPKIGTPIIIPLLNVPQTAGNFTLKDSANLVNSLGSEFPQPIIVTRGVATLLLNESVLTTIMAKSGGVYVLLGHRRNNNVNEYKFRTYNAVEPNTVHMIWQLPQYICITASEIMITKNAFEFAFSEAPAEMQTALRATWLVMMAIGNLFAVIVMKYKYYEAQSEEYRLFAYIMLIDMIIFMLLAMCCKCTKPMTVEPEMVEARSDAESQDQQKSTLSSSNSHRLQTSKSQDQQKASLSLSEIYLPRISESQFKRISSSKSTQHRSSRIHKSQDQQKTSLSLSEIYLPRISESQFKRISSSKSTQHRSSRIHKSQDQRKSSLSSSKPRSSQISESQDQRKSSLSHKKTRPSPISEESKNQGKSNSALENKPGFSGSGRPPIPSDKQSSTKKFRRSSPKSSSLKQATSTKHSKSRSRPNQSSSPKSQHSQKEEISHSTSKLPPSTTSTNSQASQTSSRPSRTPIPKSSNSEPKNYHHLQNLLLLHNRRTENELLLIPNVKPLTHDPHHHS